MEGDILKKNIGSSIVTQAIMSALSLCPGLSILVDQYSNYQQTIQYNNIVDVLTTHAEQISKLKDSCLDKSYRTSPDYVKDVLSTIQIAKDELNEEKRKIYATYLTACCHKDNTSDKNKSIYLDYLGRIDFLDCYILKSLSRFYNGRNALENSYLSYKREHDENVRKLDVQIHLEHLVSMGLIERCDKEEVDKFNQRVKNVLPRDKSFKNLNFYQRTYLGDELYNYIMRASC